MENVGLPGFLALAVRLLSKALHVQGTSMRVVPGCVKLGELFVSVCFPFVGRKRQLFHLTFAQPSKRSLELPCIYSPVVRRENLPRHNERAAAVMPSGGASGQAAE